jgi:hypothetical protein
LVPPDGQRFATRAGGTSIGKAADDEGESEAAVVGALTGIV